MANNDVLSKLYDVIKTCESAISTLDDLQIELKILKDKLYENEDFTNAMCIEDKIDNLAHILNIMGGADSLYGIKDELKDIEKEYK